MTATISRRQVLCGGALAAGTLATCGQLRGEPVPKKQDSRFHYCLNTSTIRGQSLSLAEQIAIASKAGYDGIELWIRDIQKYVDGGGKLSEMRKRIDDAGLKVESAIGFANWIVDDDERRRSGLETAKRDMELVRSIGGVHIAAPPAGATRGEPLDLDVVAERYAAVLGIGAKVGVTPLLEIWGPSKNLSRLSELAYVAIASGSREARVLPDVYHIYRGGSEFSGLEVFSGESIGLFHMNDYPDIARDKIGDADRVYPGDGVAPISDILRSLNAVGYRGSLSLELFNRDYWKQDANVVAKTGLEKMRAAVAKAGL
ncbi:MAG: sugar phosphate isomerase/epimerase [Pirellulales bacterium]|nr:sugar phosphate isomerase/epimerase [Pirellulales bacterium]